VRHSARLVVAGGLRPGNVARAIEILSPDVVDVSSGVEVEPGIKDHDRMRAFVNAVRVRNLLGSH
jgi:phosphoribosylanthranilate isomerase